MSLEPTYCEHCRHVLRVEKSAAPWRWLCIKHRRIEGFGFVTRGTWDAFPPYLYCKDVNGGCCPLFEASDAKQAPALTMETAK